MAIPEHDKLVKVNKWNRKYKHQHKPLGWAAWKHLKGRHKAWKCFRIRNYWKAYFMMQKAKHGILYKYSRYGKYDY